MHGIFNYLPQKPMYLGYKQCCSCSVFAICATCNVISPAKYVLYFYISNYYYYYYYYYTICMSSVTGISSWYFS